MKRGHRLIPLIEMYVLYFNSSVALLHRGVLSFTEPARYWLDVEVMYVFLWGRGMYMCVSMS